MSIKGFQIDGAVQKYDYTALDNKPIADATLSVNGGFADAAAVGNAIATIRNGGSGLSNEAKQALLALLEKVAYIDENGQTYYDALETALYPPTNLVSISAVYTQSGTVYDTGTLDSLKSDLVVTAYYDDSTSEAVSTYTLSGTLTEGTSTITVAYGGKTATFNVTVTADPSNEVISTFAANMNVAKTTFNTYSDSNTWVADSTIQASSVTFAWDTNDCTVFSVDIFQYDSSGNPYKQSWIQRYSSNPVTDGAIFDTTANAWAAPSSSTRFCSIGSGNITINLPTTGKIRMAFRRGSGGTVDSNAEFGNWLNNGGLTITAHA